MAIFSLLFQSSCCHVVSVALLLTWCIVVVVDDNNVLAFSLCSCKNRHHPCLYQTSSPSSSLSNCQLEQQQQPRPPTAAVTTNMPIMELDHILNSETRNQIQALVNARAAARWEGDYDQADCIKQDIFRLCLPPHVKLVLQDFPRSQGGGSTWNLIWSPSALSDDEQHDDDDDEVVTQTESHNVLHLAHAALGWAVSCSENDIPLSEKQTRLQKIVDQAKDSLQAWYQFHEILTADRSISINNPSSCTVSNDDHYDDNNAKKLQRGWIQVETTLRGRKAADAAFWFALAGVTDLTLFRLLMNVCAKELFRFGHKPTCRAKDIYQMMHRFAAAGGGLCLRCSDDDDDAAAAALESIARQCLKIKMMEQLEPQRYIGKKKTADHDSSSLLDLHADQTLLMLWKFSARQKKQQSFLQSAQKHWEKSQIATTTINSTDRLGGCPLELVKNIANYGSIKACWTWNERFADPTKPLILDIGCGMGISLLGLASLVNVSLTNSNKEQNEDASLLLTAKDLGDCNMMGVDLSGLAIGYAQGIAKRRGLSHRLQYEVDAAETVLARVRDSYPGPVSLCMIQFPTPYRLVMANKVSDAGSIHSVGNSQLPKSAFEGFMVSPKLLQLVREVLLNQNKRGGGQCGKLLLQSNCEDVAMWMQQTATKEGYQSLAMTSPVETRIHSDDDDDDNLPQWTRNWIAMGGGERAIGQYWSTVPLLPAKGATETEVACRINQTPIHRCILQPCD